MPSFVPFFPLPSPFPFFLHSPTRERSRESTGSLKERKKERRENYNKADRRLRSQRESAHPPPFPSLPYPLSVELFTTGLLLSAFIAGREKERQAGRKKERKHLRASLQVWIPSIHFSSITVEARQDNTPFLLFTRGLCLIHSLIFFSSHSSTSFLPFPRPGRPLARLQTKKCKHTRRAPTHEREDPSKARETNRSETFALTYSLWSFGKDRRGPCQACSQKAKPEKNPRPSTRRGWQGTVEE
mmetsp:Transcript_29805/g.58487  ORF Transcript_29805/g.58487 Transcript_29805/m.58487 type:complete len:243 (+) Transcript_29805:2712-3440(+)